MIPILYEKDETQFESNGLGRLYDMVSCIVTEERNGIYECDFEYPVTGKNFEKIFPGRIIGCEHDSTNDVQPFDIVSYSKPINGIVTFHAVHISYRQSGITVSGTNISSLPDAFSKLGEGQPENPFSYSTDKTASLYIAAFDGVPRTVKQILGGVEGSILDAYGGEYEFDKFNVKLWTERGSLKPITIRYGVNMLDYKEDGDYSGAYTSCVPFWTGDDGNGGQIVVRGNRVDSGAQSYNGRNECVPLDCTEYFETKPTATQLQNFAAAYMSNRQVNLPSQSISVNFALLQDSSEYKDYKYLLSCGLCDSVRVVFPRYNVEGTFKIAKTVYNVLLEKYEGVELGNLSTSLSEALGISSGGTFTSTSGDVVIDESVLSKFTSLGWVKGALDTLSSLFSFIGDVIGANPSTLTTTSKTLVGAINEVDSESAKSVYKTILGQSTATLNLSNGSRCLIICSGSGGPPMGLFIVGVSSVGVVYIKEVAALGSGYSCAADGNNKIKFTTASLQMRVMVLTSIGVQSFD